MKKHYVRDLEEGQSIQDVFFVSKKQIRQTQNREDFVDLLLSDYTGEIEARIWSNSSAISVDFGRGDFIEVAGRVVSFREKKQLVIDDLRKLDREKIDLNDFIRVCPRDRDEMLGKLREIAYSVSNPHLKALVVAFFNDEELLEKFKVAPGAKEFHHAYIGGLLEHTLSVVGLADLVCRHYTDIDRDLLITSAIFHDIGKAEEISWEQVEFDYTMQGRFLGHTALGVEIIGRLISKIDEFPKSLALELLHIVASHHGEIGFGAFKEPMTKEAIILHHLDNIDAKVWMIGHAIEESADEDWPYSKSLKRVVYGAKKGGYQFQIPDVLEKKGEGGCESEKSKEAEKNLTEHPFLSLFDEPYKKK